MYSPNFSKLATALLPWFLRSAKSIQWVGVLSFGPKLINERFNSFRLARDYSLYFTGSRIYLERWLNDKFDPINRGIVIQNIQFSRPPIIYNKIEGRDRVSLYNKAEAQSPTYIYTKEDLGGTISFSVILPANIPANKANQLLVRNEVDKFVIAGRKYEVKNP